MNNNLGIVAQEALDRRQYKKAILLFRQATNEKNENPELHLGLALSLYNEKAYSEAEKECQIVISLDPNFSRAHALLGMLYAIRGEKEKAKIEISKSLELDPKTRGAYAALAYIFIQENKYLEAEKMAKAELASREKDDDDRPHILLASIYSALNRYDKVLSEIRKAYSIRPGLNNLFKVILITISKYRVILNMVFLLAVIGLTIKGYFIGLLALICYLLVGSLSSFKRKQFKLGIIAVLLAILFMCLYGFLNGWLR